MKLITYSYQGQLAAGFIDGDAAVMCATGPDAQHAVLNAIRTDHLTTWAQGRVSAGPFGRRQLARPHP